MKKFLSLALAVIMLLSLIPFSTLAAKPEIVTVVTDSDNAYESISAALEVDATNGTTTALDSTNWSLKTGDSIAELADWSKAVAPLRILTYSGQWTNKEIVGYNAYRYGGSTNSLTVYRKGDDTYGKVSAKSEYYSPAIADNAIFLATAKWGKYVSLTYTAPKTGVVNLTDPDNTDIAAVGYVNGTNLHNLDNQNKYINVAIYKNGEKIWPAVGETVKLIGTSPAVAFPELKNIQVSEGDKINITFYQGSDTYTCGVLLNPQVDYVEETVKVINSNAGDDIGRAIAADNGATTKTGLEDSYWSIGKYSNGAFTDGYASATVGDLQIQKNDNSWVTYSGKYAYSIGSNRVYAYDLNADDEISLSPQKHWDDDAGYKPVTEKGVLITGSASLKFTAPKDGYVKLYDPTGGYISAIAYVNSNKTGCLDNTNKKVNFTISKNNEKIWPQDKDSYSFHLTNQGVTYAEFPTVELYLEQGDEITFNFVSSGTETNKNIFTLNPQVDYVDTVPDVAADVLSAALAADKANGTKNFLQGTNWSFKYSTTDVTTADVVTYKSTTNSDGYLNTTPYSNKFAYSPIWYVNLTAYDADDFDVFSGRSNGAEPKDYVHRLPESGLLFSAIIGLKSVTFTYTAPQTGKINLYDPDGGYIEAVKSIGTISQTGTLDDSKKTATLAIYKNDEKIWPVNADKYTFNYQNTYVKFPEIKALQVNAGDKINIVFADNEGGPLSMALNPAVEYFTPETGDLNADGVIDILDFIRIKKIMVNNDKLNSRFDLTGDENVNSADLIELRKFLLGITDVFEVDKEFPQNIISRVVSTASGKTYVEKDGQPYDMTAVHIRPDLIIQKYGISDKEGYDTYLKPYFAAAAELGFKAINLQLHWRIIETAEGVFNWDFLQTVYEYLNEYNLDVQLLWCGSDNCGYYYDNVPAYVRNGVGTKYNSITSDNGIVYLDYSDDDLIKDETNAVANLMAWLAENDTAHRTAAIQIENEPNYGVPGFNTAPSADATAEEVAATTWVGGQEDAILNLINEIGLVIKNSDYSVVTRVNFVSFHCYYNGVSDSLAKAAAMPGIDLVGMSCFEPDTTMDTVFMKKLANICGNIPYIAESVAGYASLFAKTLNAYDLGGFLMPYELKASDGRDDMSIFEVGDDITFNYRDGSDVISNFGGKDYYEVKTADWIGFNNMIKAVGSEIAMADTSDFAVFNLAQTTSADETLVVGGRSFVLSNSTGGVGFVLKASDGSYIIYNQKGGKLTVNNNTVNGCISAGYFENGQWVETGKLSSSGGGNQFSLSANTVYRIAPDQFK